MINLLRINLVCHLIVNMLAVERNNVCRTFKDYSIRDVSSNCWYNPDVTASAYELIMRHGYPLEVYNAITEDFYILTVFRIPPRDSTTKGIVFLQHPATASASVWVDLGKRSFAFMLADAGYDVWMGNFRGTIYSPGHIYLSQGEQPNKYWNFSFHEMGLYDMPAMFKVVMEETGSKQKMYYVGHSASTTSALIYSSLKPDEAAKYIQIFICWSPIAFLEHVKTPGKVLAPFADIIMWIAQLTRTTSGPTYDGILHKFLETFCFESALSARLCAYLVQLLSGPDPQHFSAERFPIMVYQNIAGFSLKATTHFAQIFNAGGRFQWYDYGESRNKYYYNSKQPPVYPVEKIKVPMYFVYGGRDYLSVEEDVLRLYNTLPVEIRYGIRKVDAFNHVDFHYANGVERIMYQPTLQTIEQIIANITQYP